MFHGFEQGRRPRTILTSGVQGISAGNPETISTQCTTQQIELSAEDQEDHSVNPCEMTLHEKKEGSKKSLLLFFEICSNVP